MLGNHGICTSENHDLLAWLALHESMLNGRFSRTSDTSIWREEMNEAISRRGDYSVEGLIGETPERRLASLVGNLSLVRKFKLAAELMGADIVISFNHAINSFADLSSWDSGALLLSLVALQACKQLPTEQIIIIMPTDDDIKTADVNPGESALSLVPWDNVWTCVLWDHKKPGSEYTVAPNTSIPRSEDLQTAIKTYMAYMVYIARKKLDENDMEIAENDTEIDENAMDVDENQPEVPGEFLNALKGSWRKAAGGPKAMREACQIFKSSLKSDDEWKFAIWALEQIDKRFPDKLDLTMSPLPSRKLEISGGGRLMNANVPLAASDSSSDSSSSGCDTE